MGGGGTKIRLNCYSLKSLKAARNYKNPCNTSHKVYEDTQMANHLWKRSPDLQRTSDQVVQTTVWHPDTRNGPLVDLLNQDPALVYASGWTCYLRSPFFSHLICSCEQLQQIFVLLLLMLHALTVFFLYCCMRMDHPSHTLTLLVFLTHHLFCITLHMLRAADT